MPSPELVWCVKKEWGQIWHATNTGRKPLTRRRLVRTLCAITIGVRASAALRWPDCQRCLDILCARAQKAATKGEK